MDYSAMMKIAGGSLGGMGQGMMDQQMRRTYGTARSGGYQDLMENDNIGDFARGNPSEMLMQKFQKLQGMMNPYKRGQQGPATAGATGSPVQLPNE